MANRRIAVAGKISLLPALRMAPFGIWDLTRILLMAPAQRTQATTKLLILHCPYPLLTCVPRQDLERKIRSSNMTESPTRVQLGVKERSERCLAYSA